MAFRGGIFVAIALAGCSATVTEINNKEQVAKGESYQAQYRAEVDSRSASIERSAIEQNADRCPTEPARAEIHARVLPDVETLSPGDLVEVLVGTEETLSRGYKVSQDGTLRLPLLKPIRAQGLTVEEVERALASALVAARLYVTAPPISVRISDAAGARVFVSGAVFEPGAVIIGGVSGANIDGARQKALGWIAEGRRLSHALQSAGGVRPDADLARIRVKHGVREYTIDARPALTGKPWSDMILSTGDEVEAPSRGCFQEDLMTPSGITTPGVKVFMSNLTVPAAGNSISAISKDTTELRYGTRFIQAIVGMNCVGGARATNADRSAVLFTHNPVTKESIVISRRIEDLVARADRDDFNPYILPGDALACYDSAETNLAQIASAYGVIATSASLLPKFR